MSFIVGSLPFSPHFFLHGGFEIQAKEALKAARNAGVEIQFLNPWSCSCDFDILHLWGLHDNNFSLIQLAKNKGIKVILSALLPFETIGSWIEVAKKRMHSDTIWNNLHLVDAIVVVSHEQSMVARSLLKYKGIIHVIPNIIDDIFIDNESTTLRKVDNIHAVCVGSICTRKRQLVLVNSAIDFKFKLTLVGGPDYSDFSYFDKVKHAIDSSNSSNISIIENAPYASQAILSLYSSANIFVLLSKYETQPISALEAMCLGLHLVFPNRPWAQQLLFRDAHHIQRCDSASVYNMMMNIVDLKKPAYRDPSFAPKSFSSASVGNLYKNLYHEVFFGK